MFEDIGTAAAWVMGIILLLTTLGVAWALVRGSYTKARMEALRTSLDDTDKELVRERNRTGRLELRVRHLEAENETLKSLVLQRAEFDSINNTIRAHEENAERRHEVEMSALRRLGNDDGK